MSKPTIVIVDWVDAVASLGWEGITEKHTAHACQSIGWLVYEDDKVITLAGSLSRDVVCESNNRMTIPIGWIVSRKSVRT